MAVRDNEQLVEIHRGLLWRKMLSHTPAVLLLGGVLMYGYLSLCYDLFYGRLGIDPNDVGLSYTGTLARSSGFVVVYLAAAWFVRGYFLQFAINVRDRHAERVRGRKYQLPPDRARIVLALTCIAMALLLLWPMRASVNAGNHAQAGKAVTPIRLTTPPELVPLPPFVVLAIHADPATVEPAGKPGDSPAADRLQGKRLLYLGQSGGTVVLYDADVQRAIYVSGSSIMLQVANCRAKPPPDDACQ
jgi:hypothetical protein